jgi:Mlc titration factor MtfA (ptsG expression regulator)
MILCSLFLLVLILMSVYFFFIKKELRVRKIKSKEFASSYKVLLLQRFHPYRYLKEEQKTNLHSKVLYFLEYKNFWSIGDFYITEDMKVLIAAQACLLILKQKSIVSYPSLVNIYISYGAFIEKENDIDLRTMLPKHALRLGESWLRGPLVLSWENVEEDLRNWHSAHNVVYHEFTHQLDGMDGQMDGTPILKESKQYRMWEVIMGKNFKKLRQKARAHLKSDIDKYGATNEAEFFAVTVEAFFCTPKQFSQKHPDIFKLYKGYFELNPLHFLSGKI